MNRYVFRKEYFGGLVYDAERWRLDYLDEERAKEFLRSNKARARVYDCPKQGHLSAPLKMFMEIHNLCNAKCKHCMKEEYTGAESLGFESIKNVLNQLNEIGVIELRLSGGEPTLHKDFFRIVEEAKKNNLVVTINTNGICTRGMLEALADSMIDRFHISLDGLESENDYLRGKGSFRKALSSIMYLRGKNKYVRIVTCVRKENLKDISGLIKLAEECDCDIKFSPVAGVGSAKRLSGLLTKQEVLDLAGYFKGIRSRVNVFYNIGTLISDFREYCQTDDFDSTNCGSGLTTMRIEFNGDVYGAGCGSVTSGIPLGTIEDSLYDLWEKAQRVMAEKIRAKGGRCSVCRLDGVLRAWLSDKSSSFNFKRAEADKAGVGA